MELDIQIARGQLLQSLINTEREQAGELIRQYAGQYSFSTSFTELFHPVLEEIGNLWYQGKVSLAQGYVAGLVAEDVYQAASRSEEFRLDSAAEGKVAVIGNVEDDYHALGRRLLGVFLQVNGWKVIDLGNDVLPETFVQQAQDNGAQVIGVSAMMYTTATNIPKIRNEMDKRHTGSRIALAAGGAVFRVRRELYREVGADATADNAIEACTLFDNLFRQNKVAG